jgi:hypothetical protein
MTFSERPEARWAMWCGIAGGLATAALSVRGIHSSAGATAVIGYVLLPFLAALGAVLAGIWGAALGHVVLCLRGKLQGPRLVFAAALAAAAALPAAVGHEIWRGLSLQAAVHAALAMDVAQLEQAYGRSEWNRDKYFLGAIAQNRAARAALLARIAALDDPELYRPMGSIWDVMGTNREGLAVMRLLARHPNTDAETLSLLAARPGNEQVLHDVLANPRTPPAALEPHLGSTASLAEQGLALNPRTPQRVLVRLAGSPDPQTRLNLAHNPATPREVLDRLARDPALAGKARLAIEQRR